MQRMTALIYIPLALFFLSSCGGNQTALNTFIPEPGVTVSENPFISVDAINRNRLALVHVPAILLGGTPGELGNARVDTAVNGSTAVFDINPEAKYDEASGEIVFYVSLLESGDILHIILTDADGKVAIHTAKVSALETVTAIAANRLELPSPDLTIIATENGPSTFSVNAAVLGEEDEDFVDAGMYINRNGSLESYAATVYRDPENSVLTIPYDTLNVNDELSLILHPRIGAERDFAMDIQDYSGMATWEHLAFPETSTIFPDMQLVLDPIVETTSSGDCENDLLRSNTSSLLYLEEDGHVYIEHPAIGSINGFRNYDGSISGHQSFQDDNDELSISLAGTAVEDSVDLNFKVLTRTSDSSECIQEIRLRGR